MLTNKITMDVHNLFMTRMLYANYCDVGNQLRTLRNDAQHKITQTQNFLMCLTVYYTDNTNIGYPALLNVLMFCMSKWGGEGFL